MHFATSRLPSYRGIFFTGARSHRFFLPSRWLVYTGEHKTNFPCSWRVFYKVWNVFRGSRKGSLMFHNVFPKQSTFRRDLFCLSLWNWPNRPSHKSHQQLNFSIISAKRSLLYISSPWWPAWPALQLKHSPVISTKITVRVWYKH